MAADHFERYFAEKLWEMIPEVYRHEDGLAQQPGVLRAIVEVLAGQAAVLRRSQDRLWEDQFIELCSDWATPYIGDLLGTRLISALNERGRRVDVAKTIYYRRRKGTLRILEELISDITGWEGKVVENFRRLARARHGLDPHPAPLAGRFSGTMPGGWADLRQPLACRMTGGPFDEFFHTPDVRRHKGQDGRYNIPKLAFHLYRLKAYPLKGITPYFNEAAGGFTFDPSGRDISLFIRRNRPPDWEEWQSALPWELPAPMSCRLLGHARYRFSTEALESAIDKAGLANPAADALRRLRGWFFEGETRLRTALRSPNEPDLLQESFLTVLLRYALAADCGKQALLPNAGAVDQDGQLLPDHGSLAVVAPEYGGIATAEFISAANLRDWTAHPDAKGIVADPERGRFLFPGQAIVKATLLVNYHYGFSGTIGAGGYDRRYVEKLLPGKIIAKQEDTAILPEDIDNNGIAQLDDSRTYGPVASKMAVRNLALQAANRQRPYLRLETDWVLKAFSGQDALHPQARLRLDGLWIGALSGPLTIRIQGSYQCVEIRHCTLDPGGPANCMWQAGDEPPGRHIHPVSLQIEGFVEKLCISNSILGSLTTSDSGLVETASIEDSIIQSIDDATPAVDLGSGMLEMRRCTVFGNLLAHRLSASEVILTRQATVTDTQSGCFRFSAAPKSSRLPRPYESFLFQQSHAHWFNSSRFGHPAYGQLSEAASEALRRGAENGSEMGAFSSLLNPVKLDGLKAKAQEYMPFGLIPLFIHET
ncbi:MAG: hypothetical protein KIPDCIKN_00462 [Haliscomenobacter sp.]|nr:hypothetical protein [Haliscomenobacter sp.]